MTITDIVSFENDEDTLIEPTITINTLKERFKDKKAIGRSLYKLIYTGKKSILGTPIKPTDTVIEIAVINEHSILRSHFINIQFKYVIKREIKDVANRYMSLDHSRRILLLVEYKYMTNPKYMKHRNKIMNEFL